MTPQQFLPVAYLAAINAGHIFPEYAACEAALESAWGESQLAREGKNLFGQKQSKVPIYETMELPTHEYISGHMAMVNARWVKFPGWAESFSERMKLLHRLAPQYPDYKAALEAKDGESFVRRVSRTWSTDPNRAQKVLSIYKLHADDIVLAVDVDSEISV